MRKTSDDKKISLDQRLYGCNPGLYEWLRQSGYTDLTGHHWKTSCTEILYSIYTKKTEKTENWKLKKKKTENWKKRKKRKNGKLEIFIEKNGKIWKKLKTENWKKTGKKKNWKFQNWIIQISGVIDF